MHFKMAFTFFSLILNFNLLASSLIHIPNNPNTSLQRAQFCGVKVTGKVIWALEGSLKQLNCFRKKSSLKSNQKLGTIGENALIQIQGGRETFRPDEKAFYLAKKEFNLPAFLKKHPTYDGRGVKVGVIDDGVSPHLSGFQKTSDGKRKYLAHFSNSSFFTYQLKEVDEKDEASDDYLSSYSGKYKKAWVGVINEENLPVSATELDLNGDGEVNKIKLLALNTTKDKHLICIDVNSDKKVDREECFGGFQATGEYGFWDKQKLKSLMADFDPAKGILKINEGEGEGDSHGEGVASVMAGHQIADKFDGVAPGAQLLDYDIGEYKAASDENLYTIRTFLNALETLGEAGAEVVNISYSLFFMTPETQTLMQEALEKLVEEYNFVISFSAGNNGPGLSSLNRREIYPEASLVVGAYVSKELDSNVHGASGLPDEGRVVYYSSRGPGPDGGRGPLVISPLASLTHSDTNGGFRAFGGTSSAAPAMGGLAAVLMSGLKQLNLPIHAGTITHSLRLSAKRLPHIAFIDQGNGIPQIEKALEIYKTLIKGKQFEQTLMTTRGKKRGVILKTSDEKASLQLSITMESKTSKAVEDHQVTDLLKTIKLQYSDSWISGPEKLWVSVASSRFVAQVNLADIPWDSYPRGEVLSEITAIDSETGLILQTFPITIIKDEVLNSPLKRHISLGVEEGKRFHFSVTKEIKGIRFKTSIKEHLDNRIIVGLYDPAGVKINRAVLKTGEDSLFFATPGAGHYQLGFARSKGTFKETKISLELGPIKLDSLTRAFSPLTDELSLSLLNKGERLEGRILLKKLPEVLSTKMINATNLNSITSEVKFVNPGTYSLKLSPVEGAQYSYFSYRCLLEIKNSKGEVVSRKVGRSYDFEKADENAEVEEDKEDKEKNLDIAGMKATCLPFDFVAEDESNNLNFLLRTTFEAADWGSFKSEPILMEKGENTISLESVEMKDDTVKEALKGNWEMLLSPSVKRDERHNVSLDSILAI